MRRPPSIPSAGPTRPATWRSLAELEGTGAPGPEEWHDPSGEPELDEAVSRRSFLGLMGASLGLAGLTGCRRPEETIVPFARAPEEIVPGRPLFFATAMPWMGTSLGLLVESHEGRPTKIEGNPRHPESLGGTHVWAQASVLDLYDPDRSPSPLEKGLKRNWDQAAAALNALGQRLASRAGAGLAVLTEAHRSPTLAAQLAELERRLPGARVFRYEPLPRDNVRQGAQLAFGRSLDVSLHLERAKVLVALDADLLFSEGSPVRQAHGFAAGRLVEKPGDRLSRLYVVEGLFSVTGAAADHRLRLSRGRVPEFAFALARQLVRAHGLDLGPELAAALERFEPGPDERLKRFVTAVARDLARNRGRAVVAAGIAQPPLVHAVVHLLNHALGNAGGAVNHVPAFDDALEGPASLASLADLARQGKVETLLVLGGNPVYTAPADVDVAKLLAGIPTSIHLSSHVDETSALTTWHLNRAHALESWGDVVAEDGAASIVQPLIAPLFGGRTDAELVDLLLGPGRRAYDLVRSTWRAKTGPNDFEAAWRRALHDGVWEVSDPLEPEVEPRLAEVARALEAFRPPPEGMEVSFHPDSHAWDGRFANNGWLQETPDPMTKLTWDNAALVSPATAVRLGVKDGDLVEIAVGDARLAAVPALVAPGQADDVVALTVGQGRWQGGRVSRGVGFHVGTLRRSQAFFAVQGAKLRAVGGTHALARTQEHHAMEGRPLVRQATLARFAEEPDFARHAVEVPPLKSLFPDHEYAGHKWGMVIDLNACVGCNACVVACQAENNGPLVGKPGVLRRREMHWLRVDRYFEGKAEDPKATFQPILCQQCENAPCEQVCPVAASTHSPEGLNDQAYNRCVGTRYCANNCPFKVRRFNFFNYAKDLPELRKLQHNPDVTVRSRGVMEKCTFCVQRINRAKIAAHEEGRDRVRDGQIATACEQACPARAIRFGDLNDPAGEASRLAAQPRAYRLLEELNVRPRVSFLARVTNPNPELEGA